MEVGIFKTPQVILTYVPPRGALTWKSHARGPRLPLSKSDALPDSLVNIPLHSTSLTSVLSAYF